MVELSLTQPVTYCAFGREMISTLKRTPGTLRLDVCRDFRYNMSWKARVKRRIFRELARLFHWGGGVIVFVPFRRGGETWLPYPMY
jgi:hypothetical protein